LFGLEDLDRLPWQCLSDPTAVEEPFPFAFVEGEDPIRSANMLYAQRFLKRNDLGESPIKVFLDGEVRDIAVDEVLALLNAATNVSLEGDLYGWSNSYVGHWWLDWCWQEHYLFLL